MKKHLLYIIAALGLAQGVQAAHSLVSTSAPNPNPDYYGYNYGLWGGTVSSPVTAPTGNMLSDTPTTFTTNAAGKFRLTLAGRVTRLASGHASEAASSYGQFAPRMLIKTQGGTLVDSFTGLTGSFLGYDPVTGNNDYVQMPNSVVQVYDVTLSPNTTYNLECYFGSHFWAISSATSYTGYALDTDSTYSLTIEIVNITHSTPPPEPVTFSIAGSYTYDGTPKTPTITPNPVNATFTTGGTTTATDAGAYTATATATGGFTGSNNSLVWTIAKANQSVSISPSTQTITPGQSVTFTASGGHVAYAWSGQASGSGSSKTVTFPSVGTYTVSVVDNGNGNFNASDTATATITVSNPPPVNHTVTVAPTFVYGQPISVTTRSTDAAGDLTHHHIAVSSNAWSTSSANNWEGSDPNGWKWRHFQTIAAVNGSDSTVNFTLTDSNYGTGTNLAPGTYNITINGQDSVPQWTYDASRIMATFTITQAPQATLTASSGSTTYGNTIPATTSGGSGSGAITWAVTGGTASGASVSPSGVISATSAGTVVVTATKASDGLYNAATASTTATFTQRPITVTLGGSKVYDGNSAPTGASASMTAGSLAAGDSIAAAIWTTPSTNTGSYTGLLTATISNGAENRTASYAITYDGAFVIYPAPASFSVNGPFTYNGSAQSVTITPSVAGATYTTSGTTSATNAGTYNVTVTATGNFSGSANLSWTIAKANQPAVTVSPTTASTLTNGSLTFTASGGAGSGAYTWTHQASGNTGATTSVTFPAAGSSTVGVYRAGDTNYNDSATATATVTVDAPVAGITLTGNGGYDQRAVHPLNGATTQDKTWTITNTGNATLSVSGITFSGDSTDFSLLHVNGAPISGGTWPIAIPAVGTATFTVRFDPTAKGERIAAANVHHNAPGLTSSAFLTGLGLLPQVVITWGAPVPVNP